MNFWQHFPATFCTTSETHQDCFPSRKKALLLRNIVPSPYADVSLCVRSFIFTCNSKKKKKTDLTIF
uniref:Uncharacterized protein n=1 Tax=Anguilla anguilla TaxID=7936 RepID=A0A0E9UGD1_ANGAN